MTSREIMAKTIRFERPVRRARTLPDPWGNDLKWQSMDPHLDPRPGNMLEPTADEWGSVWHNLGASSLGEVKDFPLKEWTDFPNLKYPDPADPARWEALKGARQRAGEKFLVGGGVSLYERIHFLRGLENTWIDIYENPDELRMLIDLLVDMNITAIDHYAEADCDGFFHCDDWGLQDRLMIDPAKWVEFWQPAYARVYGHAHDRGMLTLLHSCGDIRTILDPLIEAGLDVIQMDQQQNMGLENLAAYAGRITFWCPVDIQNMMNKGSLDEIRTYVHRLIDTLGTDDGGFIAGYYGDPRAAGHRPEAIEAMCDEFCKAGCGD
jgi:hypothetical protein